MRRLALAAVLALGFAVSPASPAAAQSSDLVGTFRIDAGGCSGGTTGSWFRMILPTGDRSGPYLANGDSTCADQTVTLLGPGRDGGLVTGGYQPEPSPGFDASGNSLANGITGPARFFGVLFSTSTNATDPQTGAATTQPRITASGGSLSGDLSAFAASWNDQEFNQGGPKPGGGLPGNTAAPTGTYDAATGAFTLEWSSQIVGGPFDKFTGFWHLEGTFVPAGSPGSPPPTTAATTPPAAASGGSTTPTAPGVTAPGSTAPGATTPGATTPTPVAATGDDEVAAPSNQRTTSSTADADEGWAPPSWLVVLIAVLGLLGFGSYVGLDRAVRRIEGSAEA